MQAHVMPSPAATPLRSVRSGASGSLTIRFEGALDALTVGGPRVRSVITDVLDARPNEVVVDLGLVTLLDSSGVGAIVSLFKRLKAQGATMRVVGAHGQPLAVLELLKLDVILGR